MIGVIQVGFAGIVDVAVVAIFRLLLLFAILGILCCLCFHVRQAQKKSPGQDENRPFSLKVQFFSFLVKEVS